MRATAKKKIIPPEYRAERAVLARRLKELRRVKGLTQEGLAETAGVDVSYVSALEQNGRVNPTLLVLQRIARALGVGVGELFPSSQAPRKGSSSVFVREVSALVRRAPERRARDLLSVIRLFLRR